MCLYSEPDHGPHHPELVCLSLLLARLGGAQGLNARSQIQMEYSVNVYCIES